jgi:hypothetical protein
MPIACDDHFENVALGSGETVTLNDFHFPLSAAFGKLGLDLWHRDALSLVPR